MKKRTLSLVLAALLALGTVPFASGAEPSSGVCGPEDNLTWTLDEAGVLTLSGQGSTGARNNMDGNYKWPSVTAVVVEEGVTAIGNHFFKKSKQLVSVTLPDTVTVIGTGAFENCPSLERINLPAGLTSLGESAFRDCASLKEIALPEGITVLEPSVFSGCKSLPELRIPEGVTAVGSSALYGCESLQTLEIPASVTEIGTGAFGNCAGLAEVKAAKDNPSFTVREGILYDRELSRLLYCPAGREGAVAVPESVTAVDGGAFSGCAGLTEIRLPDSVREIGAGAFSGCSSLTKMILPEGLERIPSHLFQGCSGLTSVQIPDSVRTLYMAAFSGCRALASVRIPEGVTDIPEQAFLYCHSLTSVTLPDSVSRISSFAFSWCDHLREIHIPGKVSSIPWGAFESCSALTDVYYNGPAERWQSVMENMEGNNGSLASAALHMEPYVRRSAGEDGSLTVEARFPEETQAGTYLCAIYRDGRTLAVRQAEEPSFSFPALPEPCNDVRVFALDGEGRPCGDSARLSRSPYF